MFKLCSQNLLASFTYVSSHKQKTINNKAVLTSNNIIRTLYSQSKKSSVVKSFFKGFIYIEIVLFVGSYLLWKRMNDSQEFRRFMKKSQPTILEGYYSLGENLGNKETRKQDQEFWNKAEP